LDLEKPKHPSEPPDITLQPLLNLTLVLNFPLVTYIFIAQFRSAIGEKCVKITIAKNLWYRDQAFAEIFESLGIPFLVLAV
jgi:hypothetical protein